MPKLKNRAKKAFYFAVNLEHLKVFHIFALDKTTQKD
jgi:hypothetical protein